MLPLLRGEVGSVRSSHVHNTYEGQYAIRDGKWLLIDHKTGYKSRKSPQWEKKHGYSVDDEDPVELYDLKVDIGQRNNLSGKHPEKVKALQALLKETQDRGFSAPRLMK